jgi:hypothetical protein
LVSGDAPNLQKLLQFYVFDDFNYGYTRNGMVKSTLLSQGWRDDHSRRQVTITISSEMNNYVNSMIEKGICRNRPHYLRGLIYFKERQFNETLGGIIGPEPEVPVEQRTLLVSMVADEDTRNWLMNQVRVRFAVNSGEVLFRLLVADVRCGATRYLEKPLLRTMTYRTGVDFPVTTWVTPNQSQYIHGVISAKKRSSMQEYLLGLIQDEQNRRGVHINHVEQAQVLVKGSA